MERVLSCGCAAEDARCAVTVRSGTVGLVDRPEPRYHVNPDRGAVGSVTVGTKVDETLTGVPAGFVDNGYECVAVTVVDLLLHVCKRP